MNRRPGPFAVLLIAACAIVLGSRAAASEVIAVPYGDSAMPPTETFYWQGQNSKAVLLLIPGGEGHLNLSPTQTDVRPEFYQTLKRLSAGAETDGTFDVVLFSNPAPLLYNPHAYPSSRASNDHLSRIASVIRFYKEKTGKPVWLMGHSNGAVSVTEYLRYEARLGQPRQIAGLIVSGARDVAYFDATPLNLPILFLHHRKDGCRDSPLASSIGNFQKVEALNRARTSFVIVETGSGESGSPCESGYHMYHDAGPEVAAALRMFMVQFSR